MLRRVNGLVGTILEGYEQGEAQLRIHGRTRAAHDK